MGKNQVPSGTKKVKPYPEIKSNKPHGTNGNMTFRKAGRKKSK